MVAQRGGGNGCELEYVQNKAMCGANPRSGDRRNRKEKGRYLIRAGEKKRGGGGAKKLPNIF